MFVIGYIKTNNAKKNQFFIIIISSYHIVRRNIFQINAEIYVIHTAFDMFKTLYLRIIIILRKGRICETFEIKKLH